MKEISGQNSDSELEDLNKLIRIKSFGGKYEAGATSCTIKKIEKWCDKCVEAES